MSFCNLIMWRPLYILQQKCLNKWIGSALLGTQWYNFPAQPRLSSQTPYPQNVQCSTKHNAYVTQRTLCSHDAHADYLILSSTILLTLIYLNVVSKLYSSREHIVTNFVSAPWAAFVNGAIQIFYYHHHHHYYYHSSCCSCWGNLFKKPKSSAVANWIEITFGTIVLYVNTHRLTESDVWFDATLLRWQSWTNFMQKTAAIWWMKMKHMPGT